MGLLPVGLHYGAEKVGATVIPISTGNKEANSVHDRFQCYGTCLYTIVCGIFGRKYFAVGLSPKDTTLRIGIWSRALTNEMRLQIEKLLNIKATIFMD